MADSGGWVVDQSGTLYEVPQDVLAQYKATPERVAELAAQAKSAQKPDSEVQGYYQQGYVVRPGDSLWSISQRLYGDGSLWVYLYYANADQVRNPNLIYSGQVLAV